MDLKIKKEIDRVIDLGADYVDVRLDESNGNLLSMKDNNMDKYILGSDYGFGIRVLYKNAWGFSSCTDLHEFEKSMNSALKLAKATFNSKKHNESFLDNSESIEKSVDIKPKTSTLDVNLNTKMDLISEISKSAMDYSNKIKSVTVSYSDNDVKKRYINSEGADISQKYSRLRLATIATSKDSNTVQMGYERIGGVGGWELIENSEAYNLGKLAAKKAYDALNSKRARSGIYTAILDPRIVGLFTHEALGHATEADQILQHDSILEGKIGQLIAPDYVTICDDPNISQKHGFYAYDDEGVRAQKTEIIKEGKLVSYLHSRETASNFDTLSTGNARAQGYDLSPIVRMSNIYVEEGDSSFGEMIADINSGIYLKGGTGGQVNTKEGKFMFGVEEAYLIEKGELSDRLRDVSISGSVLDVLSNIELVGDKRDINNPGICGKGEKIQHVPVDDGGPHIKLNQTLVGGGI